MSVMLRPMAQLQLRPLGVGETIDATLSLGRRRFGPMLMVALVLAVIPFVLTLIGGCHVNTSQMGQPVDCGTLGWIGNAAFWVATVVAAVVSTLVAAGAYADVAPDWRGAARFGLQNIWPILAATIVFGVTMVVGFIVLIVPGIILLISFGFYDAALMIERTGPMQSLGRSWRLVSGERWRIFLAVLVFVIIVITVFVIIGLVLSFLLSGLLGASNNFAVYLSGQTVGLLAIPLNAAFTAIVYLDLRVRKEHLDKEGLAAQLSGGA